MQLTSAAFKRVFDQFSKTERRLWWRVVAGGLVAFFLIGAAFKLYESTQPAPVPPRDCAAEVTLAVTECRNAIYILEKQIEQQNNRLDLLWQLRTAGSALLPGMMPPPPAMPGELVRRF